MIQIPPHTEQAPVLPAASPGVPGAGEAHSAEIRGGKNAQSMRSSSAGNRIGVFAKLLAGLEGRGRVSRGGKTGTGENAAGVDLSNKLPLAETAGKGKNTRIGKVTASAATEQTGAKKLSSKGATETELSPNDLSEQEKNILLTVGLLVNQGEDQVFPDNAHGERSVNNETADLLHKRGESVKTETLSAELSHGKEALSSGKQHLATKSAASAEEAAKATGKTAGAKNRSSAETIAHNGLAAMENQRTEMKKAPGGKEGIGRAEEVRKEKRRSAVFEVRDFRTGPAAENVSVRTGGEARVPGEAAGKDIVLELRLPAGQMSNQGQDSSTAQTTWEVKAGQAFEDLLARELHQNFNNDIVRHASVALRDEGQGTIRLALKPESLGNVKIHLEMAENKIAGRIVVESVEALRAFEREIASLEKAFRDSGFEGANLEMSLAADGGEARQQWQETEASQFLPGYYAASRYDAAVDWMEVPLILDVYQQGSRAVNVLV